MQTEKLSRREKEKLRQRQDMLAGALELFSEKGYHNVSMHEIAKKSEFAIGTLYKFFKNKEDLYNSLILEGGDRFHEMITRAMEEVDDEVEKLRTYIRFKGRFFNDNISMVRLFFAETLGASFNVMAGVNSEIRKQHETFLQELVKIFESGIKKKRFKKKFHPYHLAVCLESITNAFLSLWIEAPEQHPYPDDPDQVLDIILEGFASM